MPKKKKKKKVLHLVLASGGWEYEFENVVEDFPGSAVVKNPPANAGDTGSSPGPGRSHMPRSN